MIGRVELGAADYGTTVDYDGHPAVALAVFQLPGTNAIDTANVIYAKMKELKKRFPPGVDYADRARHHALCSRQHQRT